MRRTVRPQVLAQQLRVPTPQEILAHGMHRMRLVRAERWIDAVLPDAETCELLQLLQREPLLRIESIAYGANGRRLKYYNALHRCKSSRLHVQTPT